MIMDRRLSRHNAPTRTQLKLLDHIRARIKDGLPPTVSEMQDHMGYSSPNSIQCMLIALERKGLIRREHGMARGIFLTDKTKGGGDGQEGV